MQPRRGWKRLISEVRTGCSGPCRVFHAVVAVYGKGGTRMMRHRSLSVYVGYIPAEIQAAV